MKIAEHDAKRGSVSTALKSLYRCREYNSTPEQVVEMCMSIIKLQCSTNNASRAQTYLSKAENSLNADDRVTSAQLKAASGLVSLANSNYKAAALKFLEVGLCIGDSFNEVLLPEDVAAYGIICALATFSRTELKANLLDSKSFKGFLELVPVLRGIVQSFYHGRYSQCLQQLAEWRIEACLDMFLSNHITHLLTEIRNRALVQYLSPYLSARMDSMAEVFHTSLPEIEKEIAGLIKAGKVNSRIDSLQKVVLATQVDQRATTFQQVIQLGQEHQNDMLAFLMRANLIQNRLVVEHPDRGGFPSQPISSSSS